MTARRLPVTELEVTALPGPAQAMLFVLGERDPDMITLAEAADELRQVGCAATPNGLAGISAALTHSCFVRRHFVHDDSALAVYALTPSGRDAYQVLLVLEARWARRQRRGERLAA